MIYLIGGAPRVGKSQLLQKLIERQPMPALSCDFLYDLEQIKNLDGFSGADILTKGELFFPALKQLLINVSLRSENTAIEGEVILPSQIADLSQKDDIKACFIGFSEVDFERIQQFGGFFNWPQYKLDNGLEAEVVDLAERTIQRSEIIRSECKKYNLPYFDMAGDYVAAQQRVLDYLLGEGDKYE